MNVPLVNNVSWDKLSVCWQGVWRRAVWPHRRERFLHRDGRQSAHPTGFGCSQLSALYGHRAQRPEGTAVFNIQTSQNPQHLLLKGYFATDEGELFRGGNPCYLTWVTLRERFIRITHRGQRLGIFLLGKTDEASWMSRKTLPTLDWQIQGI